MSCSYPKEKLLAFHRWIRHGYQDFCWKEHRLKLCCRFDVCSWTVWTNCFLFNSVDQPAFVIKFIFSCTVYREDSCTSVFLSCFFWVSIFSSQLLGIISRNSNNSNDIFFSKLFVAGFDYPHQCTLFNNSRVSICRRNLLREERCVLKTQKLCISKCIW